MWHRLRCIQLPELSHVWKILEATVANSGKSCMAFFRLIWFFNIFEPWQPPHLKPGKPGIFFGGGSSTCQMCFCENSGCPQFYGYRNTKSKYHKHIVLFIMYLYYYYYIYIYIYIYIPNYPYYILNMEVLKSIFRLMDRWSNSGESSQRREHVRREEVREETDRIEESDRQADRQTDRQIDR